VNSRLFFQNELTEINTWKYTHRELITKFEEQGFTIIEDLVPLYEMTNRLRECGSLSKKAKLRIKWIKHYYETKNASLTCRYFGISRKTFYKWLKRYDIYNLAGLEDKSKAPTRRRQREITPLQEQRVVALRKQYIRYGKQKLAVLYKQIYGQGISSWKIQKTIEKHKLYYNPGKATRARLKRQRADKKARITKLKNYKKRTGFLVCLDTIVVYHNGFKRYIFTAIDKLAKIAFARMYKSHSSLSAFDFLNRLYYLLDGKIENILTDNGSEFEKYFAQACKRLRINRYYTRCRTPKDNAVNERFNRVLQEEFIQLGNYSNDCEIFNKKLTEWLIEYNFRRPHQTLNYETPISFNNQSSRVLPMWSSSTMVWPFTTDGSLKKKSARGPSGLT